MVTVPVQRVDSEKVRENDLANSIKSGRAFSISIGIFKQFIAAHFSYMRRSLLLLFFIVCILIETAISKDSVSFFHSHLFCFICFLKILCYQFNFYFYTFFNLIYWPSFCFSFLAFWEKWESSEAISIGRHQALDLRWVLLWHFFTGYMCIGSDKWSLKLEKTLCTLTFTKQFSDYPFHTNNFDRY